MTFWYTAWQGLTDTVGRRVSVPDFDAFCALLREPREAAAKTTVPGWSPALFRGDARRKSACEAVTGLAFDYDEGTVSVAAAAAFWARWHGALHTTWSHTPDRPRFRVIVPLREPVAPTVAAIAWSRVRDAAAAEGHVLDEATRDCSRLWFVPAIPPSDAARAAYTFQRLYGELLVAGAFSPGDPRTIRGPSTASAAASRALGRATDRIRATKPGTRNTALNAEAFRLAGLSAVGLPLAPDAAQQSLVAAAVESGLPIHEARRTVRSGWTAGTAKASAAPPAGSITTNAIIDLGPDEHRVVDEAVAALAAHAPDVFQRGQSLVRVQVDEDGAQIARLPRASLRERLSQAANFVRHDASHAPRRVHPPMSLVDAVAARGQWSGVPVLCGVVESPVLRPDGSLLTAPGYDPATRLVLAPSGSPPALPDRPTRDDAVRAAEALLEVVCDFPYEQPAHRAAWLACALTPFARYAVEGDVPLFLFDSNVRGAGKSKQADAVALIYAGRTMPRRAYVADEVEMKKTVTSVAAGGAWGVLFDNVASSLGGAALEMALTGAGGPIEDRLFGRNDVTVRFRLATIWMASGNNLVLHGDLARRVLPIRLRCVAEAPEERQDFRHPRLLAWIRAERTRLAGAALTILRAYCLAGRPDQRVRPWGSFEAWSDLVRAAVVWCGLPDPGDARIGLPDTARDLTAQLIAGWHEAFPAGTAATVAAAVDLVTRHEHQDRYGGLRAALIDIAGRPLDRVDLVSLGKRLDRFRDRVAGGFTFQKLPRGERGVPWRVVEVSMPAAVGPADAEGEPAPRVNGGEGKLVTGGTTTSTVGTVSPRLAPWQRGES